MRYHYIYVIFLSLNSYFFECEDGQWGIPKYNEGIKSTLPIQFSSLPIPTSQSNKSRQLSIEEAYFRHIIRRIIQKADPFVEYKRFIKNDQEDAEETIDFLIRFNSKSIVELKKLIEIYNANGQPDKNVHYKSMVDLLDSFNKMQRQKSTIPNEILFQGNKFSHLFWSKANIETSYIPIVCYYATITILILFVAYTLRSTFNISPITTIIGLSVIHAVLFEYIKLYYEATARRTSTINKGVPESCLPSKDVSIVGKISNFFRYTFTFQQDECYNYYRHIHVEPILDVSLLEALSSVFRKLIASYITEAAHTFGKSIHLLLYHFPFQWQLLVFITSAILLVIYLALLFKVEFHGLLFSTKFASTTPRAIQSTKSNSNLNHIQKPLQLKELNDSNVKRRLKRSLSVGSAFKKCDYIT